MKNSMLLLISNLLLWTSCAVACYGQNRSSYSPITRIDRALLSGVVRDPLIASYDLSSDGKNMALLVISGARIGSPLSLVTINTASQQVKAKVDLGPAQLAGTGFAFQVSYSADQQYLITQDHKEIRVYRADSLVFVRSIANSSEERNPVPVYILSARTKNVIVCAFGTPAVLEGGMHAHPVYVEAVDLNSGRVSAGWNSEDVPQAVSPDGELLAVSSSAPIRGILPLDIVDARGHKISSLDGGFGFHTISASGEILGRVRGIFLNSNAILLSADEHVDRTGHRAGSSIAAVNISNGKVEELMKPKSYSPTGDLAISPDGGVVVVGSWDVPARVYRQEEQPLPNSSHPEALLFSCLPKFSSLGAFVIQPSGLNLGGWLESRRTRLSSGGSIIAVAQDDGIILFRPK